MTRELDGNFWRRILSRDAATAWILAIFSVGFLAGIGIAGFSHQFSALFRDGFFAFSALAILILCVISRQKFLLVCAIFAGILLGLWRGGNAVSGAELWRNFVGRDVKISAIVAQDPSLTSGGGTGLALMNVKILDENDAPKTLPGQIFATISSAGATVRRSDEVQIYGKLRAGFGSFAAAISFGTLAGITTRPGADPARDARDLFGEKLRAVIPSPAADLGMGILLGQKTALPAALASAFIAASLTHIVVASGYNLTILIRFCRRIFAKISRFAALSFSALMVFGFANVTGFSPSMTRASLVAFFSLAAWYFGRRFHPLALLIYTAAITVALAPADLWGDAGWWMSFLSFAGVLIFAPLVRAFFWGEEDQKSPKISAPKTKNPPTSVAKNSPKFVAKSPTFAPKDQPKKLQNPATSVPKNPPKSAKFRAKFSPKNHVFRDTLIETFSAQLFSAPIIALMMGQFSPFGLVANLLVLPVVPAAMLLTFLAGIASFLLPHFLAIFCASPATWLLNYMIGVTKWVADFPGASQKVSFDFGTTSAILGAIFAITIFLKIRTKHDFYADNFVE